MRLGLYEYMHMHADVECLATGVADASASSPAGRTLACACTQARRDAHRDSGYTKPATNTANN